MNKKIKPYFLTYLFLNNTVCPSFFENKARNKVRYKNVSNEKTQRRAFVSPIIFQKVYVGALLFSLTII